VLVYIVRRLLWLPVLLGAVTFVTFILGYYGPGDPVQVRLGTRYTPEAAARLRREMGLVHTLAVGPGHGKGLCCCCPCATAGVWSCPSR
jgi:peptide/nickel transport system permease protein